MYYSKKYDVGAFVLSISIAIISLWPILFKNGYYLTGAIVPNGSYLGMISFSQFEQRIFNTWNNPTAATFLGIPQLLINFIFLIITKSAIISSRLLLIFEVSLFGISSYYAFKILSEFVLVADKIKPFLGYLSIVLYMIICPYFVTVGLANPLSSFNWSYAVLPLITALGVYYLEKGEIKHLSMLSIFSILGSFSAVWMPTFVILIAFYLILSFGYKNISYNKAIIRTLTLVVFIVLTNAFWVIPTFVGYYYHATGFFLYRGSIFITYNSLIYNSSWYNLFDILTLSHSTINLINLHITDATIPLLGAINTVAAFSSLLYHRSKLLVYLSLISIFTIFFAKGVNTPYGMLYYFLVIHFPGDAGAILRNTGYLYSVLGFTYSILIPLSVYLMLKSLVKNLTIIRIGIVVVVIIMLSGVFISNSYSLYQNLNSYTYPLYEPTNIPQVYGKAISFLQSNSDFRNYFIIWDPSGGFYTWRSIPRLDPPYGLISMFPDYLTPNNYYNSYFLKPYLTNTSEIGRLMGLINGKYLVFDSNVYLDYNYQNSSTDNYYFARQQDLRLIYNNSHVYIYKNLENINVLFPTQLALAIAPVSYSIDTSNTLFQGYYSVDSYLIAFLITTGLIDNISVVFPYFLNNEVSIKEIYEASNLIIYQNNVGASIISEYLANNISYNNVLIYFNPNTFEYTKGLTPVFIPSMGGNTLYCESGSTFLAKAFIPVNGEYDLVVGHNGILNIDTQGRTITTNNESISRIELYLNKGWNIFNFSCGNTHINYIYIITHGLTLNTPSVKMKTVKLNPSHFVIHVNSNKAFFLAFAQSYDPLWVATYKGIESKSIPVDGLINGFYIDKNGTFNINLIYGLQKYFLISSMISLVSIFLLSIIALIRPTKLIYLL